MKRGPLLPTIVRLICYLLVIAAYVLLLASLSGCEFLTGVARVFGANPSSGTVDAARKVDDAVGGWIWSWFFSSDTLKVAAGAAATETVRYAHRGHKKRKARKAEKKDAGGTG